MQHMPHVPFPAPVKMHLDMKRTNADPFQAEISGRYFLPNFAERSILKLLLSKICAVPFALQMRALLEGAGRKVPRKGEEEGWPTEGPKGKKDA